MENTNNVNNLPEPFVHALLGCQGRLRSYLTPLLRNRLEVDDVLQETNLALCRQVEEFWAIKDFTGWACHIAYYQVLTFRRKRARDRHVFSDETLCLLADESQNQVAMFSKEQAMLENCFAKLTPRQQTIARKRYQKNGSVKGIAKELGRPPNTVSKILCRIRETIVRCVLEMQASESPVIE